MRSRRSLVFHRHNLWLIPNRLIFRFQKWILEDEGTNYFQLYFLRWQWNLSLMNLQVSRCVWNGNPWMENFYFPWIFTFHDFLLFINFYSQCYIFRDCYFSTNIIHFPEKILKKMTKFFIHASMQALKDPEVSKTWTTSMISINLCLATTFWLHHHNPPHLPFRRQRHWHMKVVWIATDLVGMEVLLAHQLDMDHRQEQQCLQHLFLTNCGISYKQLQLEMIARLH